MNPEEFYKRIRGLCAPEELKGKRVVVIGLGSGGCRVAAELGRLGISLLLIERPGERLEEHNIVRHLLGYRSLGKSKLAEMARYLRNLNPSTSLRAQALDVVEQTEAFERLAERWIPDLIAVCTDNEQSKHAVNGVALRLGVPQVGAGVYDGGVGGEVYRVRPGEACYGCIAAQLQLPRHTPEIPPDRDYNSLDVDELRATCALNLDIEQIALLHSRFVLDELLGPKAGFIGLPAKVNLCVFGNRAVPGTFSRPLQGEFFHLARRRECLECGEVGGDIDTEADGIIGSLQGASSE